MIGRVLSIVVGLLYAAVLYSADKPQLPEGAGKDIFVKTCGVCHGPEIVIGRGNSEDGWTQVVSNMIQRGARGSEDDFAQIVQYLSTHFPPPPMKVNVNRGTVDDLQIILDLTSNEANALVRARTTVGLFKTIDDLKKVTGVDFSKLEKHRDRIEF